MKSDHIKAVVFDMGGVFVQTKDKTSRTRLAQRLDLTYDELSEIVFHSDTAYQATVGVIDEQVHWDFLAQHFGLSSDEMQTFWDEFWGGDYLDEELLAYTKILKETYPLGLLSNAWSGARDLLTRKFGFLDIFDVSVFSAEVQMAKPDHRFYEWILERLQVAPQDIVFVDDFIENIHAADALGIKTIHFKNTIQAIKEIQSITGL